MSKSTLPAWLMTIHHDGSDEFVSDLYPAIGTSVQIRLRIGDTAPVDEVYLRTSPDGEQSLIQMSRGSDQAPTVWWETTLAISEPVVNYRFLIKSIDGLWAYSAAGPTAHIPIDNTDFRLVGNQAEVTWLKTAVFYQIFPDRFANGDPTNDPTAEEFNYKGYGPKTYKWGSDPEPDQPFPIVFYGGDLQGITQTLDHLKKLGVNALYLNPIFSAHSNHKYDVIDYKQVDPHFGGEAALLGLRKALDERDMFYILDIVPNHCGYWHPWFQKAKNDLNAPEAEFFTFNSHPDDYASWLGVWSLPKLNYNSQDLRERIYKGRESVFKYWLRPPFSADGWRVDVGNMLGRQGETQLGNEIVTGIRHAVKNEHPDAYLIGENFFDATSQLQGDQWDGVMNYTGFTLPLWYWLDEYREWDHSLGQHVSANLPFSTEAMIKTWLSRMSTVPWAVTLRQFNLLDSHDTARIKSIVKANDTLMRLAAIVQFAFPGIPCIYYGDEIGMSDDQYLQSRGCMNWGKEHWDTELFQFYQKLIALRRKSPTLQNGGFQILAVEADTFTFQRQSSLGRIIVIAHRGAEARPAGPISVSHGGIPDSTRFIEYFSKEESIISNGALALPDHPQGATLWIECLGNA
jgi:alpha-glucosidase